jgi:membrane protein implicated in regulation of membrane protease activity
MTWWAWVLVGLGLLGIEVLTPGGFFVLFFGLAALVVGALAGLGVTGPAWLQWLLFSLLSVGSLVLFRRRLVERLRASGEATVSGGLVGDVAVLLDDLPPGTVGKAELRGTAWSVRHDGPEPLARGRRCRVERVEGLMLHVRPE